MPQSSLDDVASYRGHRAASGRVDTSPETWETLPRDLFGTILVPLDGSELAERALPYAQQLARELGSRLILLRVINGLDLAGSLGFSGFLPAEVFDAALQDEQRAAAEYLQGVAERIRAVGLAAEWVLKTGDPAGEIVEYEREGKASLVVMSTHGRSGLSRWVYGSVADRVLRGGAVPVLLIRTTQDAPSGKPS